MKKNANNITELTDSLYDVYNEIEKERHRIGARIREERIKQGLSQEDLSKMIQIGDRNLSRIELGRFNIGSDTLHKIANALNLKIDFVKKS